jgi:hypothetical protein
MMSMPNRRPERFPVRLSSLPIRAAALTLALAAAPALSAPSAAQERSGEDTRAIDAYRLTMPMLRKVLPAMSAFDTVRCERPRHNEVSSLSLPEMTRKLEACAPVVQSLRKAGVTPRDAALLFAALLNVSRQVALRGGKASALPPGVMRDNALLLEQNDPEIRNLTATGGQS